MGLWLSCILGNVGARFLKGRKIRLYKKIITRSKDLNKWTGFSIPVAYITQNAARSLSDITGGNLCDYMQLSLEL